MATRQDSISESESTGVSAAQLRELKQTDSTLSKVRQSANSDVDCPVDKPYFWQDGLLFHHWKPHGQDTDMVVNQLVLPMQFREKVLTLAHSVTLAGHLGKEKTRQRIMQQFFWPTLYVV